MVESHKRSIAKVVSWRTMAMLTTMIISFFVTGQLELALTIGIFEVFAKTMLQYIHERIWLKIPFGLKQSSMDYQI